MSKTQYILVQTLVITPEAPNCFLIHSNNKENITLEIGALDLEFLSYFTAPTTISDAIVAFCKNHFAVEEHLIALLESLIKARYLVPNTGASSINNKFKRKEQKLLARSVEVNVTTHCNLACYGCDHAAPLQTETFLSLKNLKEDLTVLSKVYHTVDFKLTGGEPLLHPKLTQIIDAVRRSKISDTITLFTNGLLLHRAPDVLWKIIDTMYISRYPHVKINLNERCMRALAQRHDTRLVIVEMNSFLMKLINKRNNNTDLTRFIFSKCGLKAACHTIHNGHYYTCTPAPFIPLWLKRNGISNISFINDGIPIHNNQNLRSSLQAYLLGREPLKACRYCLGTMGRSLPCKQMKTSELIHWLREDHGDIYQLIDWGRLSDSPSVSRLIGA